MKKIFGTLVFALAVLRFVVGVYTLPLVPPTLEWDRTYGGPSWDGATSVVRTDDGGYALAGYTWSRGAGDDDFWLVKTDADGNHMWNQTYGGPDYDWAYSVVQTDDGGYALAGMTSSFDVGGDDFWLVKTNATGHEQWNQTYGREKRDWAYSVVQTDDGGYAIAGTTDTGTDGDDFWLVKTNATGHEQWNRTYGGPARDEAYSMIQTLDGGYALTGRTWSYTVGISDLWLVKTNATGHEQWAHHYGKSRSEEGHSVIQTEDGGFAVAGMTDSFGGGSGDFWLVKTNATGHEQWNQTYGESQHDEARSVVQTCDGGYALAGHTQIFGPGSENFTLVKTDADGNHMWNQTYGGPNSDTANSMVQTDDGGYALAGRTESFGPGLDDFWLIKLAPASVPDIAVTDLMVCHGQTVLAQNRTHHINVTVMNEGQTNETFTLTVYWNTTNIIGATSISLLVGETRNVTFTWNATQARYKNYTLSAYATPVLCEVDTADNRFTYGTVIIVWPGDVQADGDVDLFDAVKLLVAYGSKVGDPLYNPNLDIDCNGQVFLYDAVILLFSYGWP